MQAWRHIPDNVDSRTTAGVEQVLAAGLLHDREDAERRFFGNLEFRLVAHVQFNFTPPPPGEFLFEVTVERDTEFLFYKNRPVYELLAPLGKRYVMQSYAQIADPTLIPAGRRVHELTNPEGDVYVMFAYEAESMDVNISDFNSPYALDGYPRPTGWSYSTRILERDLVLDSTGLVSVLAFRGSAPLSTWKKRQVCSSTARCRAGSGGVYMYSSPDYLISGI